jgi:hypothetical protein
VTPVLPALRRGDAIRVDMDKPSRPAVVLDVRGDVVAYTWGTGTQRSWLKHVCIGADTRAGKAMRLDKDTYFYARNVEIIRMDVLATRFRRTSGRCPPDRRYAGALSGADAPHATVGCASSSD